MKPRSLALPVLALLGLTAASLAFFIYNAIDFPQQIAIWFDSAGRPVGWTDRLSFIVTGSAAALMVPVLVVVLAGLMPRIFPGRALYLPNRGYWLAPERRQATLDELLRRAVWLGCLVQAFMFSLCRQMAAASVPGAVPRPGATPVIIAVVFAAGAVLWSVGLTRRFRKS
jgi:hypothetical protein